MISCPTCNAEQSESSKYCSACGAELRAGLSATVARQPDDDPLGGGSVPNSRPGSSHHGRFLPGTSVAGRYRIVSLVGKGGMGEVYRADDLKLGHTVALKFLPRELSSDPKMLEYFHSEVRLTRQISHPNVCRVYDIGEAGGQHFLSMEYIDGEDLRVLLRRIGRVPKDKGIQIAQQLCAGLSAAHDLGVLHRDLKPANIMLDGRGRVRITDFGLAKLAEDCADGEVAGTPAYMAPEQLVRGEATIQSDLYSLGLILYEVFTGEAAHTKGSIPELIEAHEQSSPSRPSELLEDMDPAVERALLRCLEKEPHARPQSARAVAAALPGGDPLAAALAAGETPSPELIASAGGTGRLSLRTGGGLFAALCIALLAIPFVAQWMDVLDLRRYQDAKPAVLEQNARDWIRKLGFEAPRADSVYGYSKGGPDQNAIEFWYRQSSRPLVTDTPGPLQKSTSWAVTPNNPPLIQPGMVRVRLDAGSRFDSGEQLLELLAIPENDSLAETSDVQPNWPELIEATGLDPASLELVSESDWPKNWRPPFDVDAVSVWSVKESNDERIILLASRGSKLVYFRRSGDDSNSSLRSSDSGEERKYRIAGRLRFLVILGFAGVLAFRNLRLRRCDTRGASRYAIYYLAIEMLLWVVAVHHTGDLLAEANVAGNYAAHAVGAAFRLWLYYVAMEPYVRRLWPDLFISWSRVLNGQLGDPLVGRDVLVGCLTGVIFGLMTSWPGMMLYRVSPDTISSGSAAVARLLYAQQIAMLLALYQLAPLLVLRVIFRNTMLAGFVFVILYVIIMAKPEWSWDAYAVNVGWAAVMVFLYVRFGLIAVMATWLSGLLLFRFPFTTDFSAWYAQGGLLALATILLLAGYGFYTSTLAGQRLITQDA
jgi:serine/threonine-protein kinase